MQFRSFFAGGFECSTHRLATGRRLDLLQATAHDRLVSDDYRRLRAAGISTVREGLRWHRIDRGNGRLRFNSVRPFLAAAREHGMQVIWDVCHYGYPDDLDPFSAAFVDRFAALAGSFARVLDSESDETPLICPVNEISFFAWAGGDAGHLNPYTVNRSFELKRNLVRAAIAGIEAIRDVRPDARFIHTDPLIHIAPNPDEPEYAEHAHNYRNAQFQAWDMLSGRLNPDLGGRPDYLDIVGPNFYPQNEWVYRGPALRPGDPAYVPLHKLLAELYERYERPLYVAETSIEGDARPAWLHLVCAELRLALADGVPVTGLCWYPILDYPGWVDERHAMTGLLGYVDADGRRPLHRGLAAALQEEIRRGGWMSYEELASRATA
jgi:beta-glucosidase/6-phospho-beta-glucosidase/beta-galactosidase